MPAPGRLQSFAIVLALTIGAAAWAATPEPTNSLPNPYRAIENWAKMPAGRTWGSTSGVGVDPDGSSVWVAERCGTFALPSASMPAGPFACHGSGFAPILEFDASGSMVKSFGAGLIVFPQGLSVDRDGNIWVADLFARAGKGQQVFKFSAEGEVRMTLGRPGVAGDGVDVFNAPSAILVAPGGDIFVADGHGGDTNARIVKFSSAGKFIKGWGRKGTAPGEFDTPHALAMDSQGRLFVADRNNNRIQIFDQDGNFITQWAQFSRPSGPYIDANDILYVADSESESATKNHDATRCTFRCCSNPSSTVRLLSIAYRSRWMPGSSRRRIGAIWLSTVR